MGLLVAWLYYIGDQQRFRLALQYSLTRAISVWLFEGKSFLYFSHIPAVSHPIKMSGAGFSYVYQYYSVSRT